LGEFNAVFGFGTQRAFVLAGFNGAAKTAFRKIPARSGHDVNFGFTRALNTERRADKEQEMDIGKLGMFANLKEKMDWLTQRQEVIAQNIANSDTPNYRANDLKEFDPKNIGRDRQFILAMQATTPGHSQGLNKPQNFKDEEVRKNYEVAPGKNAVILEEQMVKMNENQVDYQTMTRLYAKQKTMFISALGR